MMTFNPFLKSEAVYMNISPPHPHLGCGSYRPPLEGGEKGWGCKFKNYKRNEFEFAQRQTFQAVQWQRSCWIRKRGHWKTPYTILFQKDCFPSTELLRSFFLALNRAPHRSDIPEPNRTG